MRFEQPKPYSSEEQAEIKEELERQADEKRESGVKEEKLPEELEIESREARKKSDEERAEKLPEELELEDREEKNKKGTENLKLDELEFEEIEMVSEKSKEQLLVEAREKLAKLEFEKKDTIELIKKYKAGKLFELINPADAAIINDYDRQLQKLAEKGVASRLITTEEKQVYEEALSRKEDFEALLRLQKCPQGQIEKMYEDAGILNRAKQEYIAANGLRRAELYEKAVEEIEKMGLPEEKAQKIFKKEMEGILNKTVAEEAISLDKKRMELRIEAKDGTALGKIWKTVDKVGNWYSKQPLKYKIAISAGLLVGGLTATAVGGFAGAALAGAAGVGRLGLRVGGGAATAVASERFIKMWQERHARKETLKNVGQNLAEFIKNNDKILDHRLFELAGKKSGERTRRMIYGMAGGVIASTFFGKFIRWGVEETGLGKSFRDIFVSGAKPAPLPPGVLEVSKLGEEFMRAPEVAQKGDSVWKIIERQLAERYGEKFSGLDQGRKTYLIDHFKDKVAGSLEKYGLSNIDQIQAGKNYDFLPGGSAEIEEGFKAAGAIKERTLAEIVSHNKMIEEWVKDHPAEKLTSEKVDEILFGERAKALPEISGEEIETSQGEILGQELTAEKEPPGEEVFKEKEIAPAAETQIETKNVAQYNEENQARAMGYSLPEYQRIRNIRINVFLQEFPPRYRAWDVWRSDPYYYNRYNPYAFGHHVRAAELIRGYYHYLGYRGHYLGQHGYHHNIGQMKVGRFFQAYGPRPLRMPLPPPSPFHR